MKLNGILELANFLIAPGIVEGAIYYDATAKQFYASNDGITWSAIIFGGGTLIGNRINLNPLGAPPGVVQGSIYYDSTQHRFFGSNDGATWQPIFLDGQNLSANLGTFNSIRLTPGVAPALATGKAYFDNGTSRFKASEDGVSFYNVFLDAAGHPITIPSVTLTPGGAPSASAGRVYYDNGTNKFNGSTGAAYFEILLNGLISRLDLQPQGSIPSVNEGSIYYDNVAHAYYVSTDGASWTQVAFGGPTTNPVSIAQGGTGASNAGTARTNLGVAASGANTDITSLGSLSTPLSILQGGTGATTASSARTNLSAAVSGTNSDITQITGLLTPLTVDQGGTGDTTFTTHGLLYGNAASAIQSLAEATDGQLIIGQTGAAPLLATLTAGTNINITNSPGAITIANTFSLPVSDSTPIVKGSGDPTKLVNLEADGLTTGTTRTLTVQDVDGTIYVTGGQDVSVADGGTGASDAETARSNLGCIGILSTITGIDGTVATTTNLYTVPGGKSAIIIGAIARLTSVTGFTVVGNAGIGANGTQDDIYQSIPLTGLSTTDLFFNFASNNVNNLFAIIPTGGVIELGIDTAYTATTAVLSVDLIGYLI